MSSSSSSSSSEGSYVNWKDHPEYYEHLLKILSAEPKPSWKVALIKMTKKFPDVNFTIDGIQAYHKHKNTIKREVEKATSELTSTHQSEASPSVDYPSDDDDEDDNSVDIATLETAMLKLQIEKNIIEEQINNFKGLANHKQKQIENYEATLKIEKLKQKAVKTPVTSFSVLSSSSSSTGKKK